MDQFETWVSLRTMQAIVNDTSSLASVEMGSLTAQGLSSLVSEYICALERTIRNKEMNVSALVNLFLITAADIFSSNKPLHSPLEHADMSSHELCDLVLPIEEAADRLRYHFCQQLICEVMSSGPNKSKPTRRLAKNNNQCNTSSQQDDLMPSFIFQELFGRLRELENVSRSIFQGKYGMAKKLLKELMEGIVVWLSNNQSFWKKTEESLDIQKGSLLKQVHVDIHFLLEIARLGCYFSDNLMTAAMDMITEMDVKMTSSVSDLDSVLPDDRWVKDTETFN